MTESVESRAVPHDGAPPWLTEWQALGTHLSAIEAAASGAEGQDATLRALRQLRASRADLDRLEHRLIASSRETGASWRHVAGALGVGSPQAAHQYFLRIARRVGRRSARHTRPMGETAAPSPRRGE